MKMKIQALYLTGAALLIGAAGVGDSVTFDTVGSWTGAAILAVLLAAGGIVCWGYGRGLEIERAEKAQLRRYCRRLRSQSGAEEKNDGMVTIHLFKDDDRYAAPVFVGVNGDSYLIQRGIDVKVPKAVAEVLEHSIKQDAEAARKSQAMQAAAGTQMMTI